jgi:protein-S-isoprenylcysteine O-methyltransferase Ste14
MNEAATPSLAKRIVRGLVSVALFVTLLFVPAGRWDWSAGWVFLIFSLSSISILSFFLWKKDPELIKERTRVADNVESWDKTILRIYGVLSISLFIVAGLDGGRFQWSSIPTSVLVLGWVGLALALAVIWWALFTNTFTSRVVRIQDDRGHQVVTDGPYRYVRHPMYVGVIIAVLAMPVVLGSWWALIPGVGIVVLFFVRTALEDRTLQAKLSGYSEYTKIVRYRLVPGVW